MSRRTASGVSRRVVIVVIVVMTGSVEDGDDGPDGGRPGDAQLDDARRPPGRGRLDPPDLPLVVVDPATGAPTGARVGSPAGSPPGARVGSPVGSPPGARVGSPAGAGVEPLPPRTRLPPVTEHLADDMAPAAPHERCRHVV